MSILHTQDFVFFFQRKLSIHEEIIITNNFFSFYGLRTNHEIINHLESFLVRNHKNVNFLNIFMFHLEIIQSYHMISLKSN